MMIITHILIGGALASFISAELVLSGFLGGLLPDLDALGDHRKTLHFPYYYGIAGISALVSYFVAGSSIWLQASVFFFSASIHCFSDTLGGGLEHRPWEETDHRGVYSHLHGKWLETSHWVYDGSKGDFLISLISGSFLVYREIYVEEVIALVLLALVYSLTRRKAADHVPENAVEKAKTKLIETLG